MNKLLIFLLLLPFTSCEQAVRVSKTELQQIFKVLKDEGNFTKTKAYIIDSIRDFSTKHLKQDGVLYKIGTCKEIESGVWSNEILDSAKIVPSHFIDSVSKIDRHNEVPPFFSFSLPYFNNEKTAFIIYYNYYCGSLCAERSLRLYKKIQGEWRFVKTFFSVVN